MPPIPRKRGRTPKYAKSTQDLAERLIPPRDRKVVTKAMRLAGNPGKTSDGLFELGPWQEFISKAFPAREGVDDVTDKRALEVEKLRLTNERLQFELDVKRRDYSANSDLEKWIGDAMGELRMVLTRMPSKLAPLVIGRTEADAEAIIKSEVFEAMSHISSRPWTAHKD